MKQEEAINSSAYKMLESMIQDKVEELQSWLGSVEASYKRAKKPSYISKNWKTQENEETFYTPQVRIGTSLDDVQELDIPLCLTELDRVKYGIEQVQKLEKEIGDLNREKLYLVQADYDWQDDGRRSERVFGVKEYEG